MPKRMTRQEILDKEARLKAEGYVFKGYERKADGRKYKVFVKEETVVRDAFSAKLEAKANFGVSGDDLGQWCA